MSMDFFGHQERARRATRSLIVYFVLAVASIVLLVYLAATALLLASDLQPTWWRPQVLLIVGAGTIAIVALAALFKTAQLRSGGAAVAQMLGGRPVAPDTQDLAERTLLNVVEEMAIAAGVVVPSVFVLDDEHGINAFAAGWGTGDAAVAVTRGALEQLDRDELQGVIGHEFSHLFHGDMRLNVRLMGVLFGILCLATIGQIILRSIGRGSGGGGGKKGGAIAALAMFALALMAIGYLGVFFGRLIKAAVSRQREFLADASSVQYTRNPAGIGMALAKIGGKVGSRIHANHKEEVTHMLFADGVQHMFARLHATHPPVEVRIEQVLPGFLQQLQRGQPPIAAVTAVAPPLPEGVVAGVAGGTARPRGGAEALVASVGAPQAEHLQRARDLLAALPFELVAATRERSGARALCCALLLERDGPLRRQQLQLLQPRGNDFVHQVTTLGQQVAVLPAQSRLPLLGLTVPALRRLDAADAEQLRSDGRALAEADQQLTTFELALLKTIERCLPTANPRPASGERTQQLAQLGNEVAVVLSAMAHAGSAGDPTAASSAFADGLTALAGLPQMALIPSAQSRIADCELAIDHLQRSSPLGKRQLLLACARAAGADGRLLPAEGELLRTLAEHWGCPMPPVFGPGGTAVA